MSAPAATACPLQATITGTSEPNRRLNSAPPSVTRRPAASGPARITSRSKPPLSMPGVPVMQSAPTSASPASSARLTAASSPAMTSGPSAFAFPFVIVTCATRSRTS